MRPRRGSTRDLDVERRLAGSEAVLAQQPLSNRRDSVERGLFGTADPQLAQTALEARLENPGFLGRAPAQVVDSERAKAQEWRSRRDLLRSRIEGLCGAV